ncbi:unnamed protein product [marine sediment metagenome]|uniref:Uncharacterized protein n=1 Tax=marine sediment metagenome TaxID=412755 RepID=X1S5U4_9ZZZZ
MDIEELLRRYEAIPPRGPRGTLSNWSRGGKITMFNNEARRLGLSIPEAYKLCREKKENAGTSPST